MLPFPGRCLWLGLASSSAPFLQALSRFEFSGFWFVFVRHSVYSLGWRRDSGCSRLRMPALWWQKGQVPAADFRRLERGICCLAFVGSLVLHYDSWCSDARDLVSGLVRYLRFCSALPLSCCYESVYLSFYEILKRHVALPPFVPCDFARESVHVKWGVITLDRASRTRWAFLPVTVRSSDEEFTVLAEALYVLNFVPASSKL